MEKKKMNYTIEFFRFMFCVQFSIVHVYMSVARTHLDMGMPYMWALDNILPFMAFSGYFLMQGFKKQQAKATELGMTPGRQAWGYLKSRLLGLYPTFLVAQLLGFVANNIWVGTPLRQWPVALLNHAGEFFGLQVTGFGLGNGFVGTWGTQDTALQVINAPLWFLSGIFICGYIVYWLLAKCEKTYIYFIAPVFSIVFYASQYITDVNPVWQRQAHIGDLAFDYGFVHVFVGLSIGCILWVVVDKLKEKQWSVSAKVIMTIAQAILMFLVIFKTWVPVNTTAGQWITINWASVHLLTVVFSFLTLLGVDYVTRFPLFNSSIWKIPGRLALYFYMFHFPIIILAAKFMNISRDMDGLRLLTIVDIVVSLIVAILWMQFNNKVIQPWLKKRPWFTREQAALEDAEPIAVK